MQFSIVTPSFNQRHYLEQTLHSVLSQQGDFTIEHIVMDGGSSDGTVKLLQSVSDPRLIWRSENDTGQSDAVNKGLRQASGDIVGWLNSDDLYTPCALAAVHDVFRDPDVKWAVGRYQMINSSNRPIRPLVTEYKNRFLSTYAYRNLLRENFIGQPSVFWRRSFGEQIGLVDQSLHHAMDYDLWLRMGKRCDPKVLDRVLSQFRLHPKSKSGRLNRERFDEDYVVASRYSGEDHLSRWIHKLNNEKIVWAYRVMQWVGK